MENAIKFVLTELVLKLAVLEKIIKKAKRFISPKALKNAFLLVSSLSILDVLVAALGGSYLSQNVGAFLGKSSPVILTDLLFLEGTIILTIGIFIAVARAWQEAEPKPDQSTEKNENDEDPHFSIQMIIVGAILIGLSITVGTLLH